MTVCATGGTRQNIVRARGLFCQGCVTGETTLALHPASEKNLAGTVELGFTVADIRKFHQEMSAQGIQFSMPPTKQDFGGLLAQFVESEGAHCSVSSQ
jgi:predicted enzyme related to lactoylglutathione lyase